MFGKKGLNLTANNNACSQYCTYIWLYFLSLEFLVESVFCFLAPATTIALSAVLFIVKCVGHVNGLHAHGSLLNAEITVHRPI